MISKFRTNFIRTNIILFTARMSCREIVRFFCKRHISDKMNHRYVYAKETNCPGVVVLQRDTSKTACLSYSKKESFRLYMSYLLGKCGKSDLNKFFSYKKFQLQCSSRKDLFLQIKKSRCLIRFYDIKGNTQFLLFEFFKNNFIIFPACNKMCISREFHLKILLRHLHSKNYTFYLYTFSYIFMRKEDSNPSIWLSEFLLLNLKHGHTTSSRINSSYRLLLVGVLSRYPFFRPVGVRLQDPARAGNRFVWPRWFAPFFPPSTTYANPFETM